MGIHSEPCKARIEKEIATREPERFEEVVTKLSTHEIKKSEDNRDSDDPPPGAVGDTLKDAHNQMSNKRSRNQKEDSYSVGGFSGSGGGWTI